MINLNTALKNLTTIDYAFLKAKVNNKQIKSILSKIDHNLLRELYKDERYIKEVKYFLNKYFKGYSDIRWHIIYASVSGIKSPKYIPYDLWQIYIEPSLNHPKLRYAYRDKNIYDKIFNSANLPKTIARIYNNQIFDINHKILSINELNHIVDMYGNRCVLKPSLFSGRGKNFKILNKENLRASVQSIHRNGSYIIQEYIEQHPAIAKYHSNSLNTMRILTININNEYFVITAVLKIGINNNIVDNVGSGGVAVGIDGSGNLKKFGLDKYARKYEQHPNTNLKFENNPIPGYDKAVDLVTSLHRLLYNFKVVSWDVAIRRNGEPVIIEFNLGDQGIDMQLNNGPLFGKYTEQILSQVVLRKWSKVINRFITLRYSRRLNNK